MSPACASARAGARAFVCVRVRACACARARVWDSHAVQRCTSARNCHEDKRLVRCFCLLFGFASSSFIFAFLFKLMLAKRLNNHATA